MVVLSEATKNEDSVTWRKLTQQDSSAPFTVGYSTLIYGVQQVISLVENKH